MSKADFDYIICGAGSAGCTVAERLSRDPSVSVLVLEAGGSDNSPIIRTPMLLQYAVTGEQFNWGYWTEPQEHLNDRVLHWPRGKTLGGSSSINAMHYMRGAPENYDEWEREYGAEGWGWETALPAFKEVQHQTRGESELHGSGGPLWVQDIEPLNPLTQDFLKAADQLQYKRNDDFNGPQQEGFGPYQVTQRGNKRCSAADAFLRPALERENCSVQTGALVRRVVIDGGRATGVEVEIEGEVRTLNAAREVILSGGAINSPQTLLLSGIGPADELRAAGVSVEHDLPGVGKNLQDHLDVTAQVWTNSSTSIGNSVRSLPHHMYMVSRWALRGDGPFTVNPVQGGAFIKSAFAEDLPDLQLVFIPAISNPHGMEKTRGHGITLHVCQLYPKSRGEITLKSTDPNEHPAIQPNYLAEEFDLDVLTDGLAKVRDILNAPAFDHDRKEERYPGADITTMSQLRDDVRARAETLYHPTSTCAMGSGDLAVTDSRCRVKGIDGLRVVDASVMPRLVGGNTNAPTIMIATRAAAMIAEDNS
ncbi:choline dehydrogenase [Maricaulis sp.]|uniref:GMC family oxidoreductase n=1 Tax=Maricaulis sp. TaxID=1486257 RepID=UPI0025E1BA7B|nr:choline dehydrogenase [Maricaulis sp.]MDF1768555.1 choline dehydrogenase [Maricaulis sp.]